MKELRHSERSLSWVLNHQTTQSLKNLKKKAKSDYSQVFLFFGALAPYPPPASRRKQIPSRVAAKHPQEPIHTDFIQAPKPAISGRWFDADQRTSWKKHQDILTVEQIISETLKQCCNGVTMVLQYMFKIMWDNIKYVNTLCFNMLYTITFQTIICAIIALNAVK